MMFNSYLLTIFMIGLYDNDSENSILIAYSYTFDEIVLLIDLHFTIIETRLLSKNKKILFGARSLCVCRLVIKIFFEKKETRACVLRRYNLTLYFLRFLINFFNVFLILGSI